MVTIHEVARDAGVSPSTVSYAISGKRRISDTTRHRVEESMRRLGYVPKPLLTTGRPVGPGQRRKDIALFAPTRPGVDLAIIMGFIDCISRWARSLGYHTLLFTEDDDGRALQQVSAQRLADAIIVMDVEGADPRAPLLRHRPHPAVLIGLPDDPGELHCVDFNFSLAGARAAEYLAGLGRRHVGFIGSPASVYQRGTKFAQSLLAGLQHAAGLHQLTVAWSPCELDADDPRERVEALLQRMPEMSGLVVHNEAALSRVLLELERRNLRIPRDVSVVAVLPDDAARSFDERIATVRIPVSDISRAAVRMVTAQVGGPAAPEIRLLSPRPIGEVAVIPGPGHRKPAVRPDR
ncbi:LacI family DNA-binding transcriptional regulator [Streptomyces sp. YU58]|uniref:LacI family DNA-binding transcriptional regulator n=1 Tax=Streptomyces sp. SX92 TaxID=3158972 RepID=UPI0027BA8D6B|nr:LacI family DNA-binding transcriptional regulator [Streptomyces coralus]WLW58209.1 LacI family DNA-binding transcriptional regulator [Streptomyces coralus]